MKLPFVLYNYNYRTLSCTQATNFIRKPSPQNYGVINLRAIEFRSEKYRFLSVQNEIVFHDPTRNKTFYYSSVPKQRKKIHYTNFFSLCHYINENISFTDIHFVEIEG